MYEIYLNFHGLGDPPEHVGVDEHPYWLTPDRFTRILELARNYGSPHRQIRFTFDDGNKSDVTTALPILRAMSQRASFFPLSDSIGMPGFVEADDIIRLRDAGMTIGSHGARHVKWTTLNNAELADEVHRSLQILSGILRQPITTVAVPFGDFNQRVLGILREIGIVTVFTSDGGATWTNAKLKTRNTIRMDIPLEVIETLLAGPPLWQLLTGVRRTWKRKRERDNFV
jgi:peptidoglycan/xylan/chitin deacetylase (PgdA/CDA1 family)